jgi:flavin reductase (DIM6/NTAB) family NADH-FMN oxidoreductase RutF
VQKKTPRPAAPTPDFVAAMGQHVSSVCVITTQHQGKNFGLTATAMSSVCADPPRLLVCINKSGTSHEMILAAGVFCVNVLDEHQEKIGKAFAGMLGKDFDRFSAGEWQELATGAPVLKSASAVFDCEIKQVIDQFTHSVIIGEVLAAQVGRAGDALLYGARKFRTLRKTAAEPMGDKAESLHF